MSIPLTYEAHDHQRQAIEHTLISQFKWRINLQPLAVKRLPILISSLNVFYPPIQFRITPDSYYCTCARLAMVNALKQNSSQTQVAMCKVEICEDFLKLLRLHQDPWITYRLACSYLKTIFFSNLNNKIIFFFFFHFEKNEHFKNVYIWSVLVTYWQG